MIKLDPLAFIKSILSSPSGKVSIKIPSEIKYLRKASSKILSALEGRNVDEGRIFDIKLCIEEAVRNAMVHGNHFNKQKIVKIMYWIGGDTLHIEVEDEGSGFEHAAIVDPTDPTNITKNSGRGVYLIRKLMDKVEYNDKGNKVTMTKILNQRGNIVCP